MIKYSKRSSCCDKNWTEEGVTKEQKEMFNRRREDEKDAIALIALSETEGQWDIFRDVKFLHLETSCATADEDIFSQ